MNMIKFSVTILLVALLGAVCTEGKSVKAKRSDDLVVVDDGAEAAPVFVEEGDEPSVQEEGDEEVVPPKITTRAVSSTTKKPTTTVKAATGATVKATTKAATAASATVKATTKAATAASATVKATTKAGTTAPAPKPNGANSMQLAASNILVSLIAMMVYWFKC